MHPSITLSRLDATEKFLLWQRRSGMRSPLPDIWPCSQDALHDRRETGLLSRSHILNCLRPPRCDSPPVDVLLHGVYSATALAVLGIM